jgi:hypothetical protein
VKKRLLRAIAGALFAFALPLPALSQPTPPAAEAHAEPERQADVPGARGRPVDAKARANHARAIRLARPTVEEIASRMAPPARGVPLQVAFGRDSPATRSEAQLHGQLDWEPLPDGGRVAAVEFTSPGAAGLRIGLRVNAIPENAVVRFMGAGDTPSFEVTGEEILETIARNLEAGEHGAEARTWWSPLVEWETVRVEFELPPGEGDDRLQVSVPEISHFVAASRDDFVEKASSSCELDVTCYSGTWGNESDAVARMLFQVGSSGYLCSGTLIADQDTTTSIPYFLTANHCINTQSAASTLQTFWKWRSSSCNGAAGPYSTVTGGATLLYNTPNTDTSFVRLNNPPPAGALYAGWSVGTSNPAGTQVTGIHHPRGDLQKISFGSIYSYFTCSPTGGDTFSCSNASTGSATFIGVTWSQGLTEPGSSGSGLFRNSGHYILGQLYGGSSACGSSVGPDFYGRFDVAYNAGLAQYLAPAPVNRTLTVTRSGTGGGTVTSSPAGISCGGTCSANYTQGTAVTLFATPAAGSTFAGWSGACGGTGNCSVTMSANATATATFNINAALIPGAPQNLAATSGSGSAVFTFQPPANTGGSAIANYTVTCNPGARTAVAAVSPITMTGLSNGTTYTCSATATNATTTGPASNAVSVTPAAVPLALVGAVSRKTHFATTYNLPIDTTKPVTGAITIEPRVDPTHRIVFQFNGPVAASGIVSVTDASGAAIGSATSTVAGNEVTIALTGVDNRRVRVALAGVNGTLNVAASIGFLGGDENMSGSVTAADVLRAKGRVGQAVSASTYLYDVTRDNQINNNDLLEIRARVGSSLR